MSKTIPLVPDPDYTPPEGDTFTSACGDREPFALMVLGDIMEPEFEDGSVIVCDPGYPLFDGAYVVVEYADDYWFRQYSEQEGRKLLKPLNPAHPDIELTGPFTVKGVVWQKNYQRKVTRYL
jgi:DNA polymerase V